MDKGLFFERMTLQERLLVKQRDSSLAESTNIIVSATTTYADSAVLVVGSPGLTNLEVTLGVGGAVLYETPEGLFEIRVLKTSTVEVTVLLSTVAPRPGMAGGLVDQDQENSLFTPEEKARIASSLEEVRAELEKRNDISREQFAFIARKLDEMRLASERLGRKDWINWVAGSLTSIVVTLSLDRTVGIAIIQAMNAALSWVFGTAMKLLHG